MTGKKLKISEKREKMTLNMACYSYAIPKLMAAMFWCFGLVRASSVIICIQSLDTLCR